MIQSTFPSTKIHLSSFLISTLALSIPKRALLLSYNNVAGVFKYFATFSSFPKILPVKPIISELIFTKGKIILDLNLSHKFPFVFKNAKPAFSIYILLYPLFSKNLESCSKLLGAYPTLQSFINSSSNPLFIKYSFALSPPLELLR